MATEPDLIPTINTAAQNPASVEQDGFRASNRPVGELIDADVYTKAAANAAAGGLPFRRIKFLPGNNADVHIRGSGI